MNKNVLAVMSIALILLLFLVPAMSVSAAGKAPTVQAAWTFMAYPADHYVLVFWDHGWGWRPDQTMSLALLDGLPAYRAAYDAAYAATQEVLDPTNKDLYDAAAEIKAHVPDPEIQARSQAVMDAVDAVVLYEGHRGKYHDAHGIGIFWPRLAADLDEPSSPQNDFEYYRNELAFSKWTDWDEFLNAYAAH